MHSTTNGSTPHTDSPNLHLIRAVCGHNGSADPQYDSMSRFRSRIAHQRLPYNLACYFCGHQVHAGVDSCTGCTVPLFSSNQTGDRGTGGPSWWQPSAQEVVGATTYFKLMFPRTDVYCPRGEGHQGPIVTDGPKPTG